MRWYVERGGEQGGPYEEWRVAEWARAGLLADARLCPEDGQRWLFLAQSPFAPRRSNAPWILAATLIFCGGGCALTIVQPVLAIALVLDELPLLVIFGGGLYAALSAYVDQPRR